MPEMNIQSKARSLRERLRAGLIAEPVWISLSLRWFSWLVALLICVSRAAPDANLKNSTTVLLVTFVFLTLMSVYPKYLRARLPFGESPLSYVLFPLMDGLLGIWAIYQTGGWDSPFYHYGVTTVLAPSLGYGLVGALLSSSLFTLSLLLVVSYTNAGFSPAFTADLRPGPDLVTTPLNPIMIALYAAFLGEVLKKLEHEMSRSKLLAAENERAKMARDIHDGVSQTLFMLAMSLETGQIIAEKEKAQKTGTHLKALIPVAQKALLELRNTMHDVDPLEHGSQTLAEALQSLVRDYHSATGQSISAVVSTEGQVSAPLASQLFRLTQEALSNACQHAQATEIKVSLEANRLEISDNGVGFDPQTVERGRGITNLESRARSAALAYSLNSGERGTTVSFQWNEEQR